MMQNTIELSKNWFLSIDPENTGKTTGMATGIPKDARPAPVPGVIQQVFTSYHGVAWYYLPVTADITLSTCGDERLLLHFGAVDYFCEIYVDGIRIGEHEGGESEFYVDVTHSWKPDSLLAVRVINPKAYEEIDGFILHLTPHRNKIDGAFHPGSSYNSGGIMLPVRLERRHPLYISDCFARGDWQTGDVDLEITLGFYGTSPCTATLSTEIFPSECHVPSVRDQRIVTAAPGESVLHVSLSVPDYKLWDIDSPNVYDLSLTLACELFGTDVYQTHFGFRDFRLKDGYFYLNGRRIFLKSSHTGNHMPEGLALPAPSMPELEYKDFQLSKAAGFNCLRFIATQATPRQLDYCDRLGLLVYEETYASWCLGGCEHLERRYGESYLSAVKRDRNHPSLTIWGLLNEMPVNEMVHFAARDILPRLRKLDNTRVVLFSSGRHDLCHERYENHPEYVPDTTQGSAANPESETWDNVWGVDGVPYDQLPPIVNEADGCRCYIGDYHTYPPYPHTPGVIHHLRTFAHNTRPAFISEYGVCSLLNVIDHCLCFEEKGTDPTAPDYLLMRSIRDRYLSDYARLGFDRAFADPVDLLRASERFNAISRRDGFDMVRANPKFVGYNMTGLLDHAICGEGPYTLFRRVKPANFDALAEGFAPIRFCLFFAADGKLCHGCHIYAGTPLTLEAVLADEDRLPDGDYRATFAVTDEDGVPVWKGESTFTLPVMGDDGLRQMAYPVFLETVTLNVAPGKYTFRAYLQNGGCPVAGEKEFFVSAPFEGHTDKRVALMGLPDTVRDTVSAWGCTVTEPGSADVLLIGQVTEEEGKALLALTEQGKRTVFLDEMALRTENGYGAFLPLPEYKVEPQQIWLYHPETALNADSLLDGVRKGFLDLREFYGVEPKLGLTTTRTPDRCAAAHFFVGGPGEYHCAQILSVFGQGRGELILSLFPILRGLGYAPMADRLLFNLLTK